MSPLLDISAKVLGVSHIPGLWAFLEVPHTPQLHISIHASGPLGFSLLSCPIPHPAPSFPLSLHHPGPLLPLPPIIILFKYYIEQVWNVGILALFLCFFLFDIGCGLAVHRLYYGKISLVSLASPKVLPWSDVGFCQWPFLASNEIIMWILIYVVYYIYGFTFQVHSIETANTFRTHWMWSTG